MGWIAQLTKCRICNHVWAAVAPDSCDMSALECPNCGNMTGDLYEEVDYGETEYNSEF
jgi:hypothetical protein